MKSKIGLHLRLGLILTFTLIAQFASSQTTIPINKRYKVVQTTYDTALYADTGQSLITNLIDDRWYGPFTFGFPICHNGRSITECYVSSNGVVRFSVPQPANTFVSGTTFSEYHVSSIPVPPAFGFNVTNETTDCLMGPWMDWNPATGSASINQYMFGTAPTRIMVFSFNDIPLFGGQCSNEIGKFKIVIHETGIMETVFINKPACNDNAAGGSKIGTHGLVDSTGSSYIIVNSRNGNMWTAQNERTMFIPFDSIFQPQNRISILPISVSCKDSVIKLKFSKGVFTNSFDPYFTEIRLEGSEGNIPIDSFLYEERYGEIGEMVLKLRNPLDMDGIYRIVVKKGADGNSIYGACGARFPDRDTVTFAITNCYKYTKPLKLLNVTVDSSKVVNMTWNRAWDLDPNFFGGYVVCKSAGNFDTTAFYPVDTLNGSNDTIWTDTQINPQSDAPNYVIRLNVRFRPQTPNSNSIGNILLRPSGDLNSDSLFATVFWNPYRGWTNPVYAVQMASAKDSVWRILNSDSLNFNNDTTATLRKPSLPGDYLIKVSTHDSTQNLTSESNWLKFNVPQPPILEYYNVVTPNGDGKNDVFYIKNLNKNSVVKLQVYNRWGTRVYQSDRYNNDWSPTELENGNYQWFAEDEKGVITKGNLAVIK